MSTPKTKSKEQKKTVPMINEEASSIGEITINNSVIMKIVSMAASEVKGVISVGGGGFVDKMLSGKASPGGIRIQEDGHGNYNVTLSVILAFGLELANVAYEVQNAIREQVIKMTNKKVARVDVIIEDVRMPAKEDSAKDWGETN